MNQKFRFALNLIFPFLAVWLESRLAIDRDWSTFAVLARVLPIAIVVVMEIELFASFRSLAVRVLLLAGVIGFVAPLFLGPHLLELIGLYSTLAALTLWSTEQNIEQTETEKPLYRGMVTICIALTLLYFTVYLGVWEGLYADLDIARTAFFSIGLALPVVCILESLLKIRHLQKQTVILAVAVSMVCSMFFLSWRITRFDAATFGLSAWILFSIFVMHAAFCLALLKPLLPEGTWALRRIRWPTYIFAMFAVGQFVTFVFIGGHIEVDYAPKDRAKGVFEKQAVHLRTFKEQRAISSTPDKTGPTLRVLNFNAWLVEGWIPQFIVSPSRDVEARAALMPAALAKYNPDIIIFQEVWKYKRRTQLASKLKKLGYRYSVQGSDSLMSYLGIGNGLLIVSRFPLDKNPVFNTFSLATRADEGPIFARKGVIKTRVNVGALIGESKWIDIYASHLGGFATVLKDGKADEYIPEEQAAKAAQAVELAEFIKSTRTSEDAILGVDLNAHPKAFRAGNYVEEITPEYGTLASVGLKDPVAELYPEDQFSLYTYDTQKNYYANSGHFSYEPPGRIDYVLSAGPSLKPLSSEQVLTDFALSDHFGLLTVFEID